MIDSIHLKNFQAHADTTLVFDKGVNVIVGRSDQGKSSIIRALRWVATNRPSGDAFIKNGESETTVTLTVDGKSITRTKGKGTNSYTLDGVEYKALRSDVPSEIAELLNFGIANIQTQHEQYFLLQSSAGEVAKTINRIADLDSVSCAVKNARHALSIRTDALEMKKSNLAKVKDEIESTAWAVPAVTLLEAVEEKIHTCDTLQNRVAKLRGLIARIKDCAVDIDASALESAETCIKSLRSGIEQVKCRMDDQQKIATAVRDINTCQSNLGTRKLPPEASRVMTRLGQDINFLHELNNSKERLSSLVTHVIQITGSTRALRISYNNAVRERSTFMQGVKKCPTCGRLLSTQS